MSSESDRMTRSKKAQRRRDATFVDFSSMGRRHDEMEESVTISNSEYYKNQLNEIKDKRNKIEKRLADEMRRVRRGRDRIPACREAYKR